MKAGSRLVLACLAVSLAAWGQSGRAEAPKSRKGHPAEIHSSRHAARQLTRREKQERAALRAQQRRQAKLASKQRKDAARNSRRARRTPTASQ